MIVSDGFLIGLPGFKKTYTFPGGAEGRGQFYSTNLNKFIIVIDNQVYITGTYASVKITASLIGFIDSFNGGVAMDENNAGQIAICDTESIYIYDYVNNFFAKSTLPDGFVPGYVVYHQGFFIAANKAGNSWILSAPNNGMDWFWGDAGLPVVGALQTAPDKCVAVRRSPGHANMIYVMGQNIIELWTLTGQQLFPYTRVSSVNMEYGVLSYETLDSMDNFTAWLGANSESKPQICYTEGTELKFFPNSDGISNFIEQLSRPEICCAFFIKFYGHILYYITWHHKDDNVSFVLDFTHMKIYTATRENNGFFPARQCSKLNNDYYFVSLIDGGLYKFNASYSTYDYGLGALNATQEYEIPMIRVCKTLRYSGKKERFAANYCEFLLEQGEDPAAHGKFEYQPKVLLSLSRDGGRSFGNSVAYILNNSGHRANRINWFGLGSQNELTPQFRFCGMRKFTASNGVLGAYT